MAATKNDEVTPKNMPQKVTDDSVSWAYSFRIMYWFSFSWPPENKSSWSTPNQNPKMMTAQQIKALKSNANMHSYKQLCACQFLFVYVHSAKRPLKLIS